MKTPQPPKTAPPPAKALAKHPQPAVQITRIELAPRSLALLLATAGALWMLGQLVAILLTVVCALILAGTLNPVVDRLEGKGLPRAWAVALVSVLGLLGMTLAGVVTLPSLWSQIQGLAQAMPQHQAHAVEFLHQLRGAEPLAHAVGQLSLGKLAPQFDAGAALSASLTVAEGIGLTITAVVLAIYILADRERMRGGLYAVIPRSFHLRLARVLANLETIVGGYIRGQLLTSLAIAVFTFALLTLCRVPNALALAAFAGLTDVLPFVGGLLATTPAVLGALPQGSVTATVVLVAMLSYQEFESRILVPKVYGRALRLPAVAVVLALLVGGKLGGILGALLALPLTAALRMLAEELRLEMPGDDTDNSDLRARDQAAERDYASQSAGTTPQEAGAMATGIAEQIRAADAQTEAVPELVAITAGPDEG
jgi:predicted PurR-regulated permease PerM